MTTYNMHNITTQKKIFYEFQIKVLSYYIGSEK